MKTIKDPSRYHNDTEKYCETVLNNWSIVCEENEEHIAYVTEYQKNQWLSYKERVDTKIENLLLDEDLSSFFSYMENLQSSIESSSRKDVKGEYLERQRRQEEEKEVLNRLENVVSIDKFKEEKAISARASAEKSMMSRIFSFWKKK